MAGGYGHVDPEDSGSWALIENMGDAYECVEELLYLVRCLANSEEIKELLKAFYSFKRGESDPGKTSDPSHVGDVGKAYLETQRVMEGTE